MNVIQQTVDWFTTSAHWHGVGGIPHRLTEHVVMSLASVLTALIIGLPIGLILGHIGKGGFLAINVSNIGRAMPSLALLIFGVQIFGIGAIPPYLALTALAIPPVVTNAYTGIRQVDPEIKEAARGMGMRGSRMLRKVELPMSVPFIMAGVRTAGVQVVATATLAAVVAWGGLGRYVIDGLAQKDTGQLLGGVVLASVLAISTELVLGLTQRLVTPAGLRRSGRSAKQSVLPGTVTAPEPVGAAS